jgi:hypothetical protein
VSVHASGGVAIRDAAAIPIDLELVASRQLLYTPVIARVELAPGDRALVAQGESVIAGTPLAKRLRDRQLTEAPVLVGDDPRRRATASKARARAVAPRRVAPSRRARVPRPALAVATAR